MLLNFSGEKLATLRDAKVTETLRTLGLAFGDVTELDVSYCGLVSLEGVEQFLNLEKLDACNNQITALAPIWGLTKLNVLKLRRNHIDSIWLRRAGSATVMASKHDSYIPTTGLVTAKYTLLDLEANNINYIRAEPSTCINVDCILLADNNIDDFSGLKSFSEVSTVDITGNGKVDASVFLDMGFNTGLRLFLQGCEIARPQCLFQALERDPEAEIIASGDVNIEHPRIVKANVLDLSNLREKEFVDFGCEFADFRYKGDMLPCELKTPREYSEMKMETSHFVVRSGCTTKNLQTISTVADLAEAGISMQNTIDNIRVCSTIGNESDVFTPMSINTMDEETMSVDPDALSRPMLSDYTTKEEDILKGSYVNDILFTKSKLIPADWNETVKQAFYAQF